jgi:uridine kinase
MARIKYVIKRNGATVPFSKSRITNAIYRAAVSVGGRDRQTAEKLSDQVVEILESRYGPKQYPTVEEIQDIVEKVLIENGHARVSKAYILYREERSQRRKKRQFRTVQRSEYIPWAKIWEVLNWSVDHGLNTVGKLNERIHKGEFPQIVAESEAAYAEDIRKVTALIEERRDQVRLVTVAGPSSSGKTTTTGKIARGLGQQGLRFVELNLDNYYFDLELHPIDEFGDYDFETPQALDIDMINQHLHRLLAGEEVLLPYYDFKTGKQYPNRTPMKLKEGDIILIDSLYGLYPPLTDGIADNMVNLYIEPLLQMKDDEGVYVRWTDMRLMRRMLRDSVHRAYGYEMTLTHWHYVRAGELRGIIPYIGSADFIINSGMPYELPIYKPKLFDGFSQWVEKYRDDPLRQDAFERASRLHKLLSAITAVEDESIIPKDSVIREFIGGLDLEETQSV